MRILDVPKTTDLQQYIGKSLRLVVKFKIFMDFNPYGITIEEGIQTWRYWNEEICLPLTVMWNPSAPIHKVAANGIPSANGNHSFDLSLPPEMELDAVVVDFPLSCDRMVFSPTFELQLSKLSTAISTKSHTLSLVICTPKLKLEWLTTKYPTRSKSNSKFKQILQIHKNMNKNQNNAAERE